MVASEYTSIEGYFMGELRFLNLELSVLRFVVSLSPTKDSLLELPQNGIRRWRCPSKLSVT